MDARRVRSFAVFVTFICGLTASCSGGNRKIADTFFTNGDTPLNLEDTDEDMAELAWIHCRTELKEIKECVEDFDLYFSHIGSNTNSNKIASKGGWLAKRTIQRAIGDLPPHVKQTLLNCLKKKNYPSHDYVNEPEPNTWLIKYRELFSGWSSLSRRYLLRKEHPHPSLHAIIPTKSEAWRPFAALIQAASAPTTNEAWRPFAAMIRAASSKSPAKAPTPASGSPSHAPAPSRSVPASSPSPTSKPAKKAPPPPFSPPPTTPPLSTTLPPPSLPEVLPASRPHGSSPTPPTDDSKNKNLVIAVIAVGCLAALLLIALILVFCFKGNKNSKHPKDEQDGERDEKLPNLGSSDVSPGASQLSHGTGRRSSKKGFRTPSMRSNLSIKSNVHNSSLPQSHISTATAVASVGDNGDANSTLLPPPGRAAPPPPVAAAPPPPPPPKAPGSRPPPPPKGSRLPNPLKSGNAAKPTPPVPNHHPGSLGEGYDQNGETDAPKTKLKPFFWDKVLANPDHSMVWHELKGGSFQVDEEMIESLFGVSAAERNKQERKKELAAFEQPNQYIQLPVELVQTLLKMAPTADEELKLRLFAGDLTQLGPAERFLKVLVDIPYAFKRLESLLFMSSLQEEVTTLKESFATLEVACKELTNSRLFLKLLEAVLKTGNRMNDGTFRGGAQAFKLDTLLKLADVKGTDGKTTLLHFVVQEIIRSEGIRAARRAKENPVVDQSEVLPNDATDEEAADYYRRLGLNVVSGLSNELVNVRKAALIDGDTLTSTVSKLGHSLAKSREFLNGEMETVDEETKFYETLKSFVQNAEVDVMWLLEEEKRMMTMVRSTADYFHGQAGKDEGLRLFVVVRDFLIILDKVCKEVKNSTTVVRAPGKNASAATPNAESSQLTDSDSHKRLFPAIKVHEDNDFSSDDENPSP
ncbi:hypothetical protein LguiB_002480 [Lonicera macranthoides]